MTYTVTVSRPVVRRAVGLPKIYRTNETRFDTLSEARTAVEDAIRTAGIDAASEHASALSDAGGIILLSGGISIEVCPDGP